MRKQKNVLESTTEEQATLLQEEQIKKLESYKARLLELKTKEKEQSSQQNLTAEQFRSLQDTRDDIEIFMRNIREIENAQVSPASTSAAAAP